MKMPFEMIKNYTKKKEKDIKGHEISDVVCLDVAKTVSIHMLNLDVASSRGHH